MIRTKNYQKVIIGFQVTVENVGNVFLRHSVLLWQCTVTCKPVVKNYFPRYNVSSPMLRPTNSTA